MNESDINDAIVFLEEDVSGLMRLLSDEYVNALVAAGKLKKSELQSYYRFTHEKIMVYQNLADFLKREREKRTGGKA